MSSVRVLQRNSPKNYVVEICYQALALNDMEADKTHNLPSEAADPPKPVAYFKDSQGYNFQSESVGLRPGVPRSGEH